MDDLSFLTITLGIFFFCGVTFLATWFWMSEEINALKGALASTQFELQAAHNCLKLEGQNRDHILAQFQQSSLETLRAIRQLKQEAVAFTPSQLVGKPNAIADEEFKSSLEFIGGLQ